MTARRAPASTVSPVADALRGTLDLFQTGIELMRQNLRRRYPEESEEDIAQRLGEWLRDRPGAESGDSPGRRIDLGGRSA
ncbi:MAG TPA: hypothetical protein VMN81_13950 [Vicinamibacterales bacterium]|nr:hypothetical protein [Vicinamibacterales bacterium]